MLTSSIIFYPEGGTICEKYPKKARFIVISVGSLLLGCPHDYNQFSFWKWLQPINWKTIAVQPQIANQLDEWCHFKRINLGRQPRRENRIGYAGQMDGNSDFIVECSDSSSGLRVQTLFFCCRKWIWRYYQTRSLILSYVSCESPTGALLQKRHNIMRCDFPFSTKTKHSARIYRSSMTLWFRSYWKVIRKPMKMQLECDWMRLFFIESGDWDALCYDAVKMLIPNYANYFLFVVGDNKMICTTVYRIVLIHQSESLSNLTSYKRLFVLFIRKTNSQLNKLRHW